MPFIADLLFGTENQPDFNLRSRVLSASTLFAVEDRLRPHTEERIAANHLFEPPLGIYDTWTGVRIAREQLLEMHGYQLRSLAVNGAGEGISFSNGIVTLNSHRTGEPEPGSLNADLVRIVRSTSRPRVIWRRLWALLPWVLTVGAAGLLLLGVRESASPTDLLTRGVLAAVAVGVSLLGSLSIYRAVKSYRPPTVVRPYRWREIVATRLTVGVGVAAALGGAVLGALLTAILT